MTYNPPVHDLIQGRLNLPIYVSLRKAFTAAAEPQIRLSIEEICTERDLASHPSDENVIEQLSAEVGCLLVSSWMSTIQEAYEKNNSINPEDIAGKSTIDSIRRNLKDFKGLDISALLKAGLSELSQNTEGLKLPNNITVPQKIVCTAIDLLPK